MCTNTCSRLVCWDVWARVRTDCVPASAKAWEAIQRLVKMGRILSPFTQRLLVDAGITKGMTVLGMGCGPGGVSLLAADLVGPEGFVLGVDANPIVLQLAEARSRDASLTQVTVRVADLRDLALDETFDTVVGRLILQRLREPAAVLSRLATHLRPGGIVALRTPAIRRLRSGNRYGAGSRARSSSPGSSRRWG